MISYGIVFIVINQLIIKSLCNTLIKESIVFSFFFSYDPRQQRVGSSNPKFGKICRRLITRRLDYIETNFLHYYTTIVVRIIFNVKNNFFKLIQILNRHPYPVYSIFQ